MNNLVYVQFNSRLLNKKKRAKEKDVDVLLANDASKAQGWIVEGGDNEESSDSSVLTWEEIGQASGEDREARGSTRHVEVRELHDLEFVSDDETEDDGNEVYEFESDGDKVLHGYGDEELEP